MKKIFFLLLFLGYTSVSQGQCMDCKTDSLVQLCMNSKLLAKVNSVVVNYQRNPFVRDFNYKIFNYINSNKIKNDSLPETYISNTLDPKVSDIIFSDVDSLVLALKIDFKYDGVEKQFFVDYFQLLEFKDLFNKNFENELETMETLNPNKETQVYELQGVNIKLEGFDNLKPKGSVESGISSSKSQSLTNFMGGAWQQQVIFGITEFLLERAKKEISLSFIDSFKSMLKRQPEVTKFLKKVFPKTMKIIDGFEEYDVKSILPEFKKAIELDYKAFPYTFPEYTGGLLNHSATANGNPTLNYIGAGMYVLSDFNKSIIEGESPIEGLMCGISNLDNEKLKNEDLLHRIQLISRIYCFRKIKLEDLMIEDQEEYFNSIIKKGKNPRAASLATLDFDNFDTTWTVSEKNDFLDFWEEDRKRDFLRENKDKWSKEFLEIFESHKFVRNYVFHQINIPSQNKESVENLILDYSKEINGIWEEYDLHKATVDALKEELKKQKEISAINLYKDSIKQENLAFTIKVLPKGVNLLETSIHFAFDHMDNGLDSEDKEYWKKVATSSTNGISDIMVSLLQKDYSAMVVNGVDLFGEIISMKKKEDEENPQTISLNEVLALTGDYEYMVTDPAQKTEYTTFYSQAMTLIKQLDQLKKGQTKKNYKTVKSSALEREIKDTILYLYKNLESKDTNEYVIRLTTSSSSTLTDAEKKHLKELNSLRSKIEKLLDTYEVEVDKKPKNTKKALTTLGKLMSFTANVASSKSYEDVQAALEAFMDPVGGFKYKRLGKKPMWYATINSYIGWNYNYLEGTKYNGSIKRSGSSMSPTLSLGIEGGLSFKCFNLGVYFGFLELGSLAAYRLDGGEYDSLVISTDSVGVPDRTSNEYITFEQVFAPTVALTMGFSKKLPIALLIGYRYTPSLWNYNFKTNTTEFRTKANVHQLYFSIVADLTLFRFNRRM